MDKTMKVFDDKVLDKYVDHLNESDLSYKSFSLVVKGFVKQVIGMSLHNCRTPVMIWLLAKSNHLRMLLLNLHPSVAVAKQNCRSQKRRRRVAECCDFLLKKFFIVS